MGYCPLQAGAPSSTTLLEENNTKLVFWPLEAALDTGREAAWSGNRQDSLVISANLLGA